ncbi:MAG: M3 family metallopeptidase [Pseudomonadota bacterium]
MKILTFTKVAVAISMAMTLNACSNESKEVVDQQVENAPSKMSTEKVAESNKKASNPFFQDYKTPFEIPPFESISVEHYKPAFEKGMADEILEVEKITKNSETATFDNTIVAMERTGQLLQKVSRVFFALASADTNPELQGLQREMSPMLSAHRDKISLNPELFARVKYVWDNKDNFKLNKEQRKLLEDYYKGFVRSGALLEGDKKKRLTEINGEISRLTVEFGQNLLAETNGFELILTKDDLAGLPEDIVIAAASAATNKAKKAETDEEKAKYQDKYVFTPHRSSMYPFLTYSTRRDLREKLYQSYILRGDNDNTKDNKKIVSKIASLRAERAALMGFESHAHYVLEERMAKTPEAVYELLNQLWQPALARAKVEVQDMQALAKAEGHDFEIASWDWWHYSEKVRQQKYALDEASIKPYLSLESVIAGAFETANKLWGLSFSELQNVPTYHPDVRAWEVKDKDGSHLGVFMGDFYTRSSKRGGAWMSSFKGQSNFDGVERPVVYNVCNFPAPVGDTPSLLSFDQVTTLFHEFGHGLHGLVTNTTYPSHSGTSGPRDYTEFPAQILEHWAGEPQLLKKYAKHYKTGESITDELIQKLQNAAKFNQGFANTEYLAASILDMDWHTLTTTELKDTDAFEAESMKKIGLIDEIVPRYRSTYFAHIFSGGYAAGYYGYVWSALLDSDGFAAFQETGDIFNQDLAAKLRTHVLEAGGTRDAMELYKSFRGREPKIEALLKVRGLDEFVDKKSTAETRIDSKETQAD